MAIVFRLPAAQVVDANGNPLSGARLRFYERGTTTPKNVFSDEGLTTPFAQPVVADSAGRWPQIYMSADRYRVQLHTAAEVLVADYDNFDPGQPVAATAGVLPLALGGTGVTTLSALQSLLGLGAASTWADIASNATTDLGAGGSSNLRITGTTNITSFGTAASGTTRTLRFASSLILSHNATSLILPTQANITTAADDTAIAVSLGGGNWIVVDYQRANGRALSTAGIIDYQQFTTVGAGTWTKPAGAGANDLVLMMVWGGGGGGGVLGGGGGGSFNWLFANAGRLGATESVTVGAGGTAGGVTGGNGGNSSVGLFLTAYGGGGGSNTGAVGGGGGGTEGAAATVTAGSGFGLPRGFGGATAAATPSAYFGGGAGASASNVAGFSVFGGAGGGASSTNTAGAFSSLIASQGGTGGTNGTAGGVACGGGGGTTSAGAGGRGEVRIWTFRAG